MFDSWLHRLQDRRLRAGTGTVSRRGIRMTAASLLDALPALGNVLYVPMQPARAVSWQMPRGLLVEAMQLAPLLQTHWLVAASTITVEGPREWIECVDRDGHQCARLHLLPDTDYLAWDGLLAGGEPVATPVPARWSQPPRPASARLLCFHSRRLAGLVVLGAGPGARVSSLSRQLAGQIARAEAVVLHPAAAD